MSQSEPAPGAPRSVEPAIQSATDEPVAEDALLALLTDEYARQILRTLDAEDGLAASALADRVEMSRATVYRRLDRLEAAGVVASSMSVRLDGNHRKQYHVAVEHVSLELGPDGVTVTAAGDSSRNHTGRHHHGSEA